MSAPRQEKEEETGRGLREVEKRGMGRKQEWGREGKRERGRESMRMREGGEIKKEVEHARDREFDTINQ